MIYLTEFTENLLRNLANPHLNNNKSIRQSNSARLQLILLFVAVILFAIILYGNAWISDDSMITMRTVDNFINGRRLTWNPGERVQAYTHPLWMFLNSFFYYIFRNPFITLYFLSFVFSIANFSLIGQKLADKKGKIFVIFALIISSKSLIDFSTSGLANPLFFLLVAVFMLVFFKDQYPKKIIHISLIYSFILLIRIDLGLLLLPPLIVVYWPLSFREKIKNAFWFFPIVIWELFSIFYYGFPFPNTAYAKINTSVSLANKLMGGYRYFEFSFISDPITLITIGLVIILVIMFRKKKMYSFVIGIILYLLYVIRIGGDFMGGRFFSVLFLIASILIFKMIEFKSWNKSILISSVLIIYSVIMPLSPIRFAYATLIKPGSEIPSIESHHEIADEKIFYFPYTGLVYGVSMSGTKQG
jgi:arabinofuranosyltransferase